LLTRVHDLEEPTVDWVCGRGISRRAAAARRGESTDCAVGPAHCNRDSSAGQPDAAPLCDPLVATVDAGPVE
jgi:hypothetical protein